MKRLKKTLEGILINPLLWRIVGFLFSIAGFTCFALSPSFHDLFGRWKLLNGFIYSVFSFILTTLMLFVKKLGGFTRSVMVKAHVGFLVMMITSILSIWQDRVSQKENGRSLNMCSFEAFGLMSLSLSMQLQLGFEVGIFNFLLGSFLVALVKMSFKMALLAAFLCYLVINIRSLTEFFMEKLGRVQSSTTVPPEDIESQLALTETEMSDAADPDHDAYRDRLREYAERSGMTVPMYDDEQFYSQAAVFIDGMAYVRCT